MTDRSYWWLFLHFLSFQNLFMHATISIRLYVHKVLSLIKFLFFIGMGWLRIQPRASHMLRMHSTTEQSLALKVIILNRIIVNDWLKTLNFPDCEKGTYWNYLNEITGAINFRRSFCYGLYIIFSKKTSFVWKKRRHSI
jgi:hypothetical protein